MLRLILVFVASVPVFADPQYNDTNKDSGTGGRVIGGVPATIEEFPYLVVLITTVNLLGSTFPNYICGGSIITKDWVLTAAHCLEPVFSDLFTEELTDVRAGSTYKDRGGVMRGVADTVSHVYPPHDIALIKVDEPWPLDGTTISLARLPRQDDPYPLRERATIMGWGRTSLEETKSKRLMKEEVLVISLEYCRAFYSFWWPGDKDPENQITAETMCTLFDPEETPSKVYKGDSGSPVLVNGEVVGIVNGGKTTTIYAPDLHARVSCYIDWIEEHLGPLPRAE